MTSPITNTIKENDWVVCDRRIGQISQIREDGLARFRDGFSELSGRILEDCRPLTLRSKAIVETFDIYYKRLKEIDGNSGFNYPDISRYFSRLSLEAIDLKDDVNKHIYEAAQEFIRQARDYKPEIHGVRLFRRAA